MHEGLCTLSIKWSSYSSDLTQPALIVVSYWYCSRIMLVTTALEKLLMSGLTARKSQKVKGQGHWGKVSDLDWGRKMEGCISCRPLGPHLLDCFECCWFQLRQKIADMTADSLQVHNVLTSPNVQYLLYLLLKFYWYHRCNCSSNDL